MTIPHPAPPSTINSWPVLAWAADLGAMLSPSKGWTGHVLCRMNKGVFVTWQVGLVDTAPFPDEVELLRWTASSGHYFEKGVNARSERDALDKAYADFVERTAPPMAPCPDCGGDPLTAPPCVDHDADPAKGMVLGPIAEHLGPLIGPDS